MELRLGLEAGMKEGSQSRASVSPGRGWRVRVARCRRAFWEDHHVGGRRSCLIGVKIEMVADFLFAWLICDVCLVPILPVWSLDYGVEVGGGASIVSLRYCRYSYSSTYTASTIPVPVGMAKELVDGSFLPSSLPFPSLQWNRLDYQY